MYTKKPVKITSWAVGYPVVTNGIYLMWSSMLAPPHWVVETQNTRNPVFKRGTSSTAFTLGF